MTETRVTVEAIIRYDEDKVSAEDVRSSVVLCFLYEDKTGVENYLPSTEEMEIVEYTDVFVG